MVAQKTQNSLAARVRTRADKAMAKHATDEVDFGFLALPGGISAGIAKLDKMGLEEVKTGDNKGAVRWFAIGTVVEPEFVTSKDGQEIEVRGRTTSQRITLADTKNSKGEIVPFEENFNRALNEVKKFVEPGTFTEDDDFETFMNVCAQLEEEEPCFHFSTRESAAVGKYPARVWETWSGVKGLENYVPDLSSATNDESGTDEEEETEEEEEPETVAPQKPTPKPKGKPVPPKPVTKPAPKPAPAKPESKAPEKPVAGKKGKPVSKPEPEPEEETVPFDEFQDLDSLIEAAMADDDDAQAKLEEMAVSAGIDEESIANADDWEAVGELIRSAGSGEEGEESEAEAEEESEEEEESEPVVPVLGDVFSYQGENGKPSKVKVTMVNTKKEIVNVRDLKSKKELRGISFSDLMPIE